MTSAAKRAVYIVSAKRTPFGSLGGKLAGMSATDLTVHAANAAVRAASIEPGHVDSMVAGTVIQSSRCAPYLARHAALRAKLPMGTPCLLVGRRCASGFQAVVTAAQEIQLHEAEVVLAAGVESMSQTPFAVRNIRFGTRLGMKYELEDTLWDGLTDHYIKTPMGVTAETLAEKYKVTREEADELALRSQTRYRLAKNEGRFEQEMAPVEVKSRKGAELMDYDEHPRDTTAEQLAKLKPVFKKDGVVTAGNASGINDGAAALLLASEEACKRYHLEPLARVVAWRAIGCDPHIMGIGPAEPIRHVLKSVDMTLDQMDLIEVNEAFAAQAVAVQKELGLDVDKLNVSGGAVALGHPVGASGARILAHLTHELRRRGAKWGLGSACIGGGEGMAVLLESIH